MEMWDDVFSPAWRTVIEAAPHKLTEFKASDCRQGQGEFSAQNGWTRPERDALTSDLVGLLGAIDGPIAPIGYSAVVAFPHFEPQYYPYLEATGFAYCLANIMQAAHGLKCRQRRTPRRSYPGRICPHWAQRGRRRRGFTLTTSVPSSN
jgi:hypothetical protein